MKTGKMAVWVGSLLVLAWSGQCACAQEDGAPEERQGPPRGGRWERPGGREAGAGRPDAGERLMEMVVSRLVENPKQAAELGISEEQLTALKDGMYELRKRQVDLNAELEKAALEQARLMTETTIDEVALMAAVEKTGSIRTELAKLRITQLLLVKKTLTAEQIEALKKKIQERMENRGRKREEGADVRGNRPERGEAGKGEGQGRDGEERRKGKKQEIRERREEKRADQQDNKKWHDEEDGDVADKMEL